MIIVMDMQSGEQEVALSGMKAETVQPEFERHGYVCPALQTYPADEEKRLVMPALVAQVFRKDR